MQKQENHLNLHNLYYSSTRNNSEKITASQAIVNGIAGDGGLYVPSFIPELDRPLDELIRMDYRQLACYILGKFLPDFTGQELKSCVDKAYDEKFDTAEVAPLVKVENLYFLELYHGATAAFKDMALSLLPHLLTAALKKTGIEKEIVILTATSGDTGKAALESFSGVAGTKIIVFYPNKGVSLIQERQMVTQEGSNTYVCAIEGNFDDAQTGVKNIFCDRDFNALIDRAGYIFSSANSINIGRLIPQVVYYINAYLRLLERGEISEGQYINIAVPTGNFGNILAAYYAKKMGLAVQRFLCASNENNVLYDFINTGVYDKKRELKLTMSPSMDILISSNLERLLYDLCNKDSYRLAGLYNDLKKTGRFSISDEMKEQISDFWGGFATEGQTLEAIAQAYGKYGYLMDTHTAVGYYVYNDYAENTSDRTKAVIAATASPFKFPGAVLKAICPESAQQYKNLDEISMLKKLSEVSGIEVPKPLKDIADKKIIHKNLCGIGQMKDFVKSALNI
ncbi:MAG: threonine synthase [Actinobacteria bacterium]|nr:threonine synthase [Actinomycetota bacterium]